MNETIVTVVGNLVADPESRRSSTGVAFTTFRVASTTRRRDPSGRYVDAGTNYYNVVAFKALGINAARSLKKGEAVVVHGRLKISQWQDAQSTTRVGVDVEAYSLGHDLTRGWTKLTKATAREDLDRMADPSVQSAVRSTDPWAESGDPEMPPTDPYADVPIDVSALAEPDDYPSVAEYAGGDDDGEAVAGVTALRVAG